MKSLRLFVLMLLVALLPIEGTAATVGMCASWGDPVTATPTAGVAATAHAPACHERMAASMSPEHRAHASGAHKCGQCAACVMSVALPMRAEWAPLRRMNPVAAFRPADVPAYRFLADALERPPRIA